MRRVLQLPAYRRLLSAYTLNEVAYSIAMVALSFLIYRRTGSAIGAAAFYLVTQFVPSLFSSLVVARLDQLPARPVLAVMYAVEAVFYLLLAWLARHFSLAPVLALAAIDGIISVSARAIGRAVTVSVTSAAGLLREGNALHNVLVCICFMVGPALGGAVVAAGGADIALLVNTGLFAAMTLSLATAPGFPAAAAERAPTAGRLRAALAYARRQRRVWALLLLQAAGLTFFTISMPVEVVYVQRTFHADAAGYGLMLSAWGAGAVAGSAIFVRWRSLPSRELLALGAALLGAGFLVMATAPVFAVGVAGAAVAGIGNGVEAVSLRTALQEEVQERWMALMMSFNESLAMFVPGVGIVLGGAVTQLTNPRIAWLTAGVGALAVTLAIWVVLGPAREQARTATEHAQHEGPSPRGSPSSAAPPV